MGRAPLADNSRFLYADETSSIADGHIVNLYGYSDSLPAKYRHGELEDYEYFDEVRAVFGYHEFAVIGIDHCPCPVVFFTRTKERERKNYKCSRETSFSVSRLL